MPTVRLTTMLSSVRESEDVDCRMAEPLRKRLEKYCCMPRRAPMPTVYVWLLVGDSISRGILMPLLRASLIGMTESLKNDPVTFWASWPFKT